MGLPTYYAEVSATDVNTKKTVSFTGVSGGAFTVTIKNDGANEVFYDVLTGVATTSSAKLLNGESVTLRTDGTYRIEFVGLICSAGETATVRITAWPVK